MIITCCGSIVGVRFRLVDVRPLLAVAGGLCSFDFEPLVTCAALEDLRFLDMGLGVALFEDCILSLEPAFVLEVKLTTWRKISCLHLQPDGLGAADLLFACHVIIDDLTKVAPSGATVNGFVLR